MTTTTTKTTTDLEQFYTQSLRGKIARWGAVAASVVGISVGMVMPVQAINRVDCDNGEFVKIIQGGGVMCFANAGEADVVIADVYYLRSGNNAGYVITNKGIHSFRKWDYIDFGNSVGPVTILVIKID